jgi:hypothetical protein
MTYYIGFATRQMLDTAQGRESAGCMYVAQLQVVFVEIIVYS